jgi:RimJ/RimL family protein N-acetyltransferase
LEALHPEALDFAESALKLSFPGGTTGITSLTDDGRIAGVAVFTPPCKGNSNLHIAAAAKHWFTPEFCRKMFFHGFITLRASRLTASIEAGNIPCQRLAAKTGFRLEGCLRGFEFGDLLMFGMSKGECKWVES